MKKLIYQYFWENPDDKNNIHNPAGHRYWEDSRRSISAYAKKIGVEYKYLDHPIPYSPFYGTLCPVYEGWAKEYDVICFVDSDILATTNDGDIFEYANVDKIGMTQMGVKGTQWWNEQKSPEGLTGHCNAGVVMIGRNRYDDINKTIEKHGWNRRLKKTGLGGYDQTWLNEHIEIDLGADKFTSLPKKYNWHIYRYKKEGMYDSVFIHYHRDYKKLMASEMTKDIIIK